MPKRWPGRVHSKRVGCSKSWVIREKATSWRRHCLHQGNGNQRSQVKVSTLLVQKGKEQKAMRIRVNDVSSLLIVRQFFFSFILDQCKVTYNALLVDANYQLWHYNLQPILELSMEISIFLSSSNDCLWMRKTGWPNENWVQIWTLPLIVHITEGTSLGFMD